MCRQAVPAITVWVGVFPLAITRELSLAATLYMVGIFALLFRVRVFRYAREAVLRNATDCIPSLLGVKATLFCQACLCRHFQSLYFAGKLAYQPGFAIVCMKSTTFKDYYCSAQVVAIKFFGGLL